MTATRPRRPVLRYHGGKWKFAKRILAQLPPHRIYVEPYGGGASILIRKARSYGEVYNDRAGEVVNVFRVLRDPAKALLLQRALRLTPFAREEFAASYQPVLSIEPVEQARRTIIRAFMGFGSAGVNVNHSTGFRSNTKRSGSTPQHDWAGYPDEVPAFVERLRGVVVENREALQLIPQHDSTETLFYVDPPYPLAVRRKGASSGVRKGYIVEMDDDGHRALARALHAVAGMVVLSGRACPFYDDELYPDWERRTFRYWDDGAIARTEVLWLNAHAIDALKKSGGGHVE